MADQAPDPTEPSVEAPEATADPTPADPVSAPTVDGDPVVVKLTELGVEPDVIVEIQNTLGVSSVDDLSSLAEKDLIEVGMKVVPARKLVAAFAPVASTTDTAAFTAAALDNLPKVPDDGPWLDALKAGGVRRVDQSTVISAIRAGLASRVGLFGVTAKLAAAMEEYAKLNDEPVDEQFYTLQNRLTQRNYAEIFAALPGFNGRMVTESRKKELFSRINDYLWPAIIDFYQQLDTWYKGWIENAGNPLNLLPLLAGGTAGGVMPPGMMAAPDTGILRDHADAINDAINKVFAGTGVQIAAAVAYDANEIKKSLEDPGLPALIGAANRDQMLKLLEVAVPATYPRLEINLTRFVLATMQVNDQPAGDEELRFFGSLYTLGQQIPWGQLGVGGGTFQGVAGNRL
ncbi:hypothetical protein KC973_02085 [Candidatus Saccharibacteria bacterium]|nr:hypothetical protein [Candidatus Saccharibacteria bacterium]